MLRIAYRTALAGLVVYLSLIESRLQWPACALLLWSFIGGSVNVLLRALKRLPLALEEQDGNSLIECQIAIEKVVAHPAVDDLFHKLLANGKAPAVTLPEWRELLLREFARQFPDTPTTYSIRFNIRNNLLYVNGEPRFNDYFGTRITLCFRDVGLRLNIDSVLSLRAIVVNGVLRLEVGPFDKATSPKLLRSGFLSIYETWSLITSFPLIYFAVRHSIPIHHLNLVCEATESYKIATSEGSKNRTAWKAKFTDWKELHQDLELYRVLCSGIEVYGERRWKAALETFKSKGDLALKAEGYEQRDDAWVGRTFSNAYLTVGLEDLRRDLSELRKHWYTNYYEERP